MSDSISAQASNYQDAPLFFILLFLLSLLLLLICCINNTTMLLLRFILDLSLRALKSTLWCLHLLLRLESTIQSSSLSAPNVWVVSATDAQNFVFSSLPCIPPISDSPTPPESRRWSQILLRIYWEMCVFSCFAIQVIVIRQIHSSITRIYLNHRK